MLHGLSVQRRSVLLTNAAYATADSPRRDLAWITSQARYWWELPDASLHRALRDPGRDHAPNLAARWRTLLGDEDEDRLERRLRWAAGGRRPSRHDGDGRPSDGWIEVLKAVLIEVSETTCSAPQGLELPASSAGLPFVHVLAPMLVVARRLLQKQLFPSDIAARRLSGDAQAALETDLLRRLSGIVAPSLYEEFSRARPAGLLLHRSLDPTDENPPASTHYRLFAQAMAKGALRDHFRHYPVVARLAATVVDQWVWCTAELLTRLDADARDISADLLGTPLDAEIRVVAVEPSLSDFHHGGRSVAILTLESGEKVVYKPRDLGMEVAFHALATWVNLRWSGQIGSEPLRVPRALSRVGYGWVEHVEHAECDSSNGARRYFRRAGALLGLLHVLRAADGHHGNLVAAGEYPVLVDAETLLHPEARPLDPEADQLEDPAVERGFRGSVLRTLVLPAWQVSGDGSLAFDISGLGGGAELRVAYLPQWRWLNTDGMVLRYASAVVPGEKNIVRVCNQVQSAHDFVDDVVAGFESMYRFVWQHRDDLLAPEGPLAAMAAVPVRFLFRHTRIYQGVLTAARNPESTRSGLRFSIELDVLGRAFLGYDVAPKPWPILAEELDSLGRLDIPYCTAQTDSDSLLVGATRMHDCLRGPVYPAVVERIRQLSDSDLAWQVSLIRGSFHAQVARTSRAKDSDDVLPGPARELSRADMLREAERVGAELAARSLGNPTDGADWLGLGMVAETERVQVELVGDALYEGRCGIGVFLAALQRVSPQPVIGELLGQTMTAVRRRIDRAPQGFGARGSMIYSLVTIDSLTDGTDALELAVSLAAAWTPPDAYADKGLDVLSGSAGAVLGLVALARATGQDAPLRVADAFGRNLLNRRVSHSGAPRAWCTLGERPLTGFSHGAAGIAHALLQLYAACGDTAFLDAALEAVEYERTTFSREHGNWPDLRSPAGDASYPDQWCHGAAGVALARLGGLGVASDDEIIAEIEAALATTTKGGLRGVDHLCCGNLGRVEALWVGATRLGRADWADTAHEIAGRALDRARTVGGYRLFPNLPDGVFNPGFYRGLAGIGYQWLRLADATLPSVLIWE